MRDGTGLQQLRFDGKKGWVLRGAAREGFHGTLGGIGAEETLPGGCCHVSTARYRPPGVGDSPAPSRPLRVGAFSGAGTRLAVWGAAP